MTPILGITILTMRNLTRGGVLPLLTVLLPAGIAGLRFAVRGDGTLSGMAQIWLEYSMGWTVLLLSAAALITAAAAISLETAAQRLQLVRVKPVTPLQIWMGNWLGLMLMNTVLLTLAGALITIGLWHLANDNKHPEDAQRALRDTLLTPGIELRLEPAKPTDSMDGQDKKTADTGLTIVPGGIHRWQTVIPPGIRRDLPARLEFVFLSARPDAPEEINTLWLMGPSDRPDSLRFRVGARHGQTHHIDLPADFLEPGRAYAIACANIHDAMPTAVAFSGNGGPQLLIPARNFAANMARAGLMILARLAFLTALGLTAGAAFSFPVAVFLAGAIPMFDRLNCFRDTVGRHWVRWAFGTDDGRWPARLLDYAVAGISQAVRLLTPTLERFNPSSMIAAARLIPWRAAGQTIGVFLLYTILLAGAGAWLIMRRQAGADKS